MRLESFAADPELIQALEKQSHAISCAKGGTLFNQGDIANGLYILRSGEAALVMKSPAGRAVMCVTVGAGSVLGLPGVIGKQPYTLTAMVRKGSDVRFVSQHDFEEVVQAKPSLYPKVLQVLASEIQSARKALCEI